MYLCLYMGRGWDQGPQSGGGNSRAWYSQGVRRQLRMVDLEVGMGTRMGTGMETEEGSGKGQGKGMWIWRGVKKGGGITMIGGGGSGKPKRKGVNHKS